MAAAAIKPAATRERSGAEKTNRLTYKEKQEYASIETRIEEAEARLAACSRAASDPKVQSDHVELQKRYEAIALAQAEGDGLDARWQELSAKAE